MVDFKRYGRLKSTNSFLTQVVLIDSQPYLTFKRFDVETGKEIAFEKQLLSVDDLKKKLSEWERDAEFIKQILHEVEVGPPVSEDVTYFDETEPENMNV